MRSARIGCVGCVRRRRPSTHYECTDGASFEVAFYPETKAAYLQIDGKSLVLPKRFSLDQPALHAERLSFSMRTGGKATMRHAGKTSQCKVQ